jgi:uncharacterized protein CbrC (UPF0167 family)
LHAREAPEGAVDVDHFAGLADGADEGRHDLERLAGDVDEPVTEKVQVRGPGALLGLAERWLERVGAARQLVGEMVRDGWMEIALYPDNALERVEERRQQRDERVDQAPLATSATTAA